MTNTATLNSGWEVAGGKKATKKVDLKPKIKKDVPKIEHAPPIKTDATIYDLIRESDDDLDEINNNKKQVKKAPVTEVKVESPKAKQARKEPKESLNLVSSSIVANQKKKTDNKVAKNPENELENALKDLKVENFEKELSQLEKLFQNNTLTINENLITYLNKELDQVPEIDPLSNHENESVYPMTKLEKSVLKFLNIQLSKMNKSDSEKFFEYCLNGLFTDNQKVPSNHGHKIGFQLIAKLNPNLSLNLVKVNEILTANKHRHQRLLIALWAIGQFGYYNLSNGIKIWFDSMLGQISVKSCTNFVSTYLYSLFQYHKLDAKSKIDVTITLDQYNKIAELDKAANLTKETAPKFKSSFDVLRGLFLQEVPKNSQNFETLLRSLPAEKSKQSDMLEFLVASVLKNKESLSKWKQCYSKYIGQSLVLIEELTTRHLKSFKSLKDTREVLRYFDEQTSAVLSQKETGAKAQFNRSKSTKSQLEIDLIKKFNKIVKQINKEHYKEISIGSMVFKTLFYTLLAVSLFFYWDANYNKSVYTNSTKIQLKKYGLLDHTLKLIESIKQLLLSIQKTVNYYLPIWQKKFSETVVPVVQSTWKTTKVYGNLAWEKSEPYRNLTIQYTNEGVKYVQTNFPVFVKNLDSCLQLAINYITTVTDFLFYYVSQFVEIVGVKLLGLKSGELGKIFLDGFKFGLDKLANIFEIMTEYFNKL